LPPIALLEKFPADLKAAESVVTGRKAIHNILNNKDQRLLVIVGPCSIHDPEAALAYAEKLLKLRQQHKNNLEVVMRAYFEKPRTTVGWKGLINDPYLDNSCKINDGLRIARKLLVDINQLGLPTAGEFLDMITPQYIADLMSWGAIGARTTESQVHRELASGLSCPVGFKNGQTNGNPDCHLILRGGKEPNYDKQSITEVTQKLKSTKVNSKIMVDFSHANSNKDFRRQSIVCESICEQIQAGNTDIFGVMIESFLEEGSQKLVNGKAEKFGQSITDQCIGWNETEHLLEKLAAAVESSK